MVVRDVEVREVDEVETVRVVEDTVVEEIEVVAERGLWLNMTVFYGFPWFSSGFRTNGKPYGM